MADSALGKHSKKDRIQHTDKQPASIDNDLPAYWGEMGNARKAKREKLTKQGAPRVASDKYINPEDVLKDLPALLEKEHLLPATELSVDDKVLHLVRNQSNKHRDCAGFRATLAECSVVVLSECPKVRFNNGTTKRVKMNSLFRRRAA